MKEFIIFVCTDSIEIFSKLRSAGLNYNLPSFALTLTMRGVSNKHLLVDFFHFKQCISRFFCKNYCHKGLNCDFTKLTGIKSPLEAAIHNLILLKMITIQWLIKSGLARTPSPPPVFIYPLKMK